MNTKDALKEFRKVFGDFAFHPQFILEIRALLSKDLKGKEAKFFKCFTTQLNYIKQYGKKVALADGHEKLKGYDGSYFSIHVKQKEFNIRLIVYIDDYDYPYFLCAFNEKAGKKATDYSQYESVSKQRCKQVLGGGADEFV